MDILYYIPQHSDVLNVKLIKDIDLDSFLADKGIENYVVKTFQEAESFVRYFTEDLKLENGVLSHKIETIKIKSLAKVTEKISELFKPYDKIFNDINSLQIPKEYFEGGHENAKKNAESKRQEIRILSKNVKGKIENAKEINEIEGALKILNQYKVE
jgi:hypothetical protein